MGRGRPHKCPYCDATKSVAKGFRYNRSGKVRLRRCKECGRRWTCGTVSEEDNCIAEPATGQYPPEPARVPQPDRDTEGEEKPQDQEGAEKENDGPELTLSAEDGASREKAAEEEKGEVGTQDTERSYL